MLSRPLRFLQGLFLYLPTTFLFTNVALAALAGFSILVFKPTFRREDRLFFLFAIGVALNAVLGMILVGKLPDDLLANNGLLGAIILIMTYLTARSLDDTVWKWVLLFICVDAACVYLQFALGIRYFFAGQAPFTVTEFNYGQTVGDVTELYYIRPLGLSLTSSAAGAKILLGILLAYILDMKWKMRWAIIIFLCGASVLNFTRSGLLTLALFFGILFLLDMRKHKLRPRHLLGIFLSIGMLGALAGDILAQLTREELLSFDSINLTRFTQQLTGRADIWQLTLKHIAENFAFGNFSQRFVVTEGFYAGEYPHSSLLDLFASHGVFLAVIMLSFYVGAILRRPLVLIPLAPLFFDSLFHEHLFWYISVMDIFALYLLTTKVPSAAWLDPWPSRRPANPQSFVMQSSPA